MKNAILGTFLAFSGLVHPSPVKEDAVVKQIERSAENHDLSVDFDLFCDPVEIDFESSRYAREDGFGNKI